MLNLKRPAAVRQYFGKENESTKKRYAYGASSSSGTLPFGTDPYNVVRRKILLYMKKIVQDLYNIINNNKDVLD